MGIKGTVMQKTPSAIAPYRITTYYDFCVSRCPMLTELEYLSKTTSQVLIFSGLARGAIAIPVQRFRSCDATPGIFIAPDQISQYQYNSLEVVTCRKGYNL
jgi:hypothetical protein